MFIVLLKNLARKELLIIKCRDISWDLVGHFIYKNCMIIENENEFISGKKQAVRNSYLTCSQHYGLSTIQS